MKVFSQPLDRIPPPDSHAGARARTPMGPSDPVHVAGGGTGTSTGPLADALDRIRSLVPPDPAGASYLPLSYWNAQQARYDDQVIAIATQALDAAQPPTLDDFSQLSPQLAAVELAEATQRYLQLRSELGDALATASIDRLRMAPAFQQLPPETRTQVVELIQAHRTDPDAVALLVQLAASDGFVRLGADGQRSLLLLIGGQDGLAQTARDNLAAMFSWAALLESSGHDPVSMFWFGDPGEIREFFEELGSLGFDVPDGPNVLPWYRETRSEGMAGREAVDHSIGTPTYVDDHDFGSGTADAWCYEVTIGERTIEVYLPAGQSAEARTANIERIATALAAAPDALLDPIERIDVNPRDDGSGIMNANAEPGVVRINPGGMALESGNAFFSGLLHECGHLVDAASATLADGRTLDEAWQQAMQDDGLAVSQAASAGEDFADAVALYLLAEGTPDAARLRELFPDRFAILDQLLG